MDASKNYTAQNISLGTVWNICDNSMDPLFWILNGIVSLLILAGNSFTCFVFLTSQQLRQNFMNNLLLSLAISDLLMGLFVVPFYSVFCSGCTYTLSGMCWLFDLFRDYAFLTSVFNLFAITYDRNIAVFKPLLYHYYMNTKSLKCFMSLIWGIPVVLALIRFTWRFSRPEEVVKIWNKYYTLLLLHVFVVFPIAIVMFINFRILASLKRIQFGILNKVASEKNPRKTDIDLHSVNSRGRNSDSIETSQEKRENALKTSPTCSRPSSSLENDETLGKIAEDCEGKVGKDESFKTLPETSSALHENYSIKSCLCEENLSQIQRNTSKCKYNEVAREIKRDSSQTATSTKGNDEVFRTANENLRKHTERAEKLKLRKGTISCVTVTSVFVLCWLPRAFYQECRLFDRRDFVNPLLLKLSLFCLFLQSSLNPFIYSIYRSEFRRAALKLLKTGRE